MAKTRLDLTIYTDSEILEALMDMPMSKLMPVLAAIGNVSERANKRGELLSQRLSDSFIDRLLRGEEYEE